MTNTLPVVLSIENDQVRLLAELADKLTGWMATAHVYRNCLTCSYFIEQMEICEKYSQRPPARIIAYGCDAHSAEIPF